MTLDKDFKRIVRARMQQTGETYSAARAALVASPTPEATRTAATRSTGARSAPPPDGATRDGSPRTTTAARKRTTRATDTVAATSTAAADEAALEALAGMASATVKAKTGCGWTKWVYVLDQAKATTWTHTEIARYLASQYKVDAWWAQSVTVGYERIRGLRVKGQRRDGGYEASKSRTFAVPVATLFAACKLARQRNKWLPDAGLTVRKTNGEKSILITWADGTHVQWWFTAKGGDKSALAVQHSRLATRQDVELRKAFWSERLDALAQQLAPRLS